jgi:mono/diheme cytochrome c family protein
MKTLRAVLLLVVLLAATGLGFIFSGLYNVAADDEHTNPVQWLLRTTQSRSVHRRAEQVRPPAWMANPDPAVLRRGLLHYEEMCVTCHGAPGVAISEVGQGLNPPPPELSSHAEDAGETFWIVKHGIKMTGMPAFGVTHDDDEIWAIVAFLQAMPKMTKEEYERMVEGETLTPGPSPKGEG